MGASFSVGSRIRELRERTGMQSQELAGVVGVDPSAMSNIERDKRAVKTNELASIASALGVSPLAILEEHSLLARLPVAPRSPTGVLVDSAAYSRLVALTELHEVLSDAGIDASPKLGEVPPADLGRWVSSANELAEWARSNLGTPKGEGGRFPSLVGAIRKTLGVDVYVEPSDHEELAGASITDRSFPMIFVNADQPTTRALFTLAHELGHVLAGDGDVITVDIDLAAHDEKERFANAFAAALLMPEDKIRARLDGSKVPADEFGRLLDEFGVSFESLVYRLHNIGLINASGRDTLRQLGLRGIVSRLSDQDMATRLLGRLGKRPEQSPPTLLLARTLRGYKSGVVSVRPLAGLLGQEPDHVLSVMGRDVDDALGAAIAAPATARTSDEERYGGEPV